MKNTQIPANLEIAFSLFVDELEKHISYFDEIMVQLKDLEEQSLLPEPLSTERAEALEKRFHTIRGGASFLGLKKISESAEHGESLFRDCPEDSQKICKELSAIVSELQSAFREIRN